MLTLSGRVKQTRQRLQVLKAIEKIYMQKFNRISRFEKCK